MSVFRRLLNTERDRYQEHLLRLDAEDRHARFAGTVSDDGIIHHCQRLDWRYAIVIGFFDLGELKGACEINAAPAGWPERAEAAFSVEKPWQNRGVGSDLIRRGIAIARAKGVHILDVVCLMENRRMQALARKHNGKMEIEQGEVMITIDLTRPTQVDQFLEVVDDGDGALPSLLDQLHYGDDKAHTPFHGWSA